MENIVNALKTRLPDAVTTQSLDTAVKMNCSKGWIDVRTSITPGRVTCLLETGSEMEIQQMPDGSLEMCVQDGIRMTGSFNRCNSYQDAVDQFLEFNEWSPFVTH